MSENAIGYLLNRAGYHGRHVPHGFRAAFSTIMNEWAARQGKKHDRKIIDLMLAHILKAKIAGAYNRAAYMPSRRDMAQVWADIRSRRHLGTSRAGIVCCKLPAVERKCAGWGKKVALSV